MKIYKKKEKIIAVTIMFASVSILFILMALGKMLGRDISNQQEYLQEQFPLQKNESEPARELDYSSFHDPQFSRTVTNFTVLFIISCVLVLLIMAILKKGLYDSALRSTK